ncbi:MAG: hypothetical protein ACK5RL_03970, partial [Acidimicrobiales bacterium]
MTVRLDPADLVASITAAAADLATGTAVDNEWVLPARDDGLPIEVAESLVIDAGDRNLVIRGEDDPTPIHVTAGATGVGIELLGEVVGLRALDVTVEGDEVTGVVVHGRTEASLAGCSVRVSGRHVVGAAVRSDRRVVVVDLAVGEARSTVGDAIGLVLAGATIRAHRLRIESVVAA